jgi:hypothetical protein
MTDETNRLDRDEAPGYADDTTEDLLDQARSNAQATIIATIAFLQGRGIAVAEWTAALGRVFDRAWDEPVPWEAGEFLDAMLTNLRSLGAEVGAADLGPDRAEATTTGFPDPELCALFGVDPAHVAAFNDVPIPIAAARSLDWDWSRDGELTRYVVRRKEKET